jgi:anthraniloyl-CoA monooxygenase
VGSTSRCFAKLRHSDWEITVCERNPAGSTYGWGLVFWDELLDQLRDADPVSGQQISEAALNWVDQVVYREGTASVSSGHGYSIPRQRLLDILAKRALELGVRIEYGREVKGVSELEPADLIVASDGANSGLRGVDAGRFGTEVDMGRNKYIWLGASTVFDSFTFLFVRTPSGWIWAHAYGIDDGTSTFIVECSPETWSGLGFDAMTARETLVSLESVFAPHLQGGSAPRARAR